MPVSSESCHTARPLLTVFDKLSHLNVAMGKDTGTGRDSACSSLLVAIKDGVARDPAGLQGKHVPVLYVDAPGGNQLWGNGASLYQAGCMPIPPNMEFVGTLMLSDTVEDVPARVYYNEEQNTVFTVVHDCNLYALECDLGKEAKLPNCVSVAPMDQGALKLKGASVLPSFLRSATEPYYLVREGIAPVLALRAPCSTKELVGGALDKGNSEAFTEKVKGKPTSKFITIFTKSCASPSAYPTKMTAQEAKVAAEDTLHGIMTLILSSCGRDTSQDADSEAETSMPTPSPPRWTERPVRQLAVRACRAKTQVARTLYGTRAVADKEVCLLTNMLDVARAIAKEILPSHDELLLGRFLSDRFRNGGAIKADVLEAIASSLDSKCSIAFVTLAVGGGGELAPPLLLAHGGCVVETTSEHLARLIGGGHSAVFKFSHMENRVRQVCLQGVTRATCRLSETFRTSMVTSLINDSKMEVVARPPVAEVRGFREPTSLVPECADVQAALLRLDAKRRRVEERAEREEVLGERSDVTPV